ncbi:23S rRNA (adenine(2503)-C(2))-methyltransferase RlmN [bacterium]|nr:23S rRNA (adenine(2503)-C(2))-methyltransferase RlmN [candidate division CSSED10-310 bacterium]
MTEEIQGLTAGELTALVESEGHRPYRARQLLRWLYRRDCLDYEEMTDLPAAFRSVMAARHPLVGMTPLRWIEASDGTQKVLLELTDKARIEAVFMPYEDRCTVCISTQVGCPLGCRFCATGALGFTRHLSAAEIIAQLTVLRRRIPAVRQGNIVLMGMGEPLLNVTNVLRALRIMTADWGMGLSKRKITVSTAGIIPGMRVLADSGLGVNLSVSLNAPVDLLRSRLMPINTTYPLRDLMDACRAYPLAPGRRITYEYVLIKDFNDQDVHAGQLVDLLDRRRAKINLIPLNPTAHFPFQPPSPERLNRFQEILFAANLSAFIRESKGAGITAACGQLAAGEP